jgi:membrane protease YdiL (CAAX protease family)
VRTLALIGLVAALLAVTALASPWVAWGVSEAVGRPFTFSRVYNRVFEVLLVVALLLGWRRLDLGGPAEIGLRRPRWARELATGCWIGAVSLGVALAVAVVLGGVDPALRYPAGKTVQKALLGAGAALAIGVGEELLFRGALLRRITRDAGVVAGVALTTAIYAAVHAIGKGGRQATAHAWAGVERTAALFAPLGRPEALPELIGLALLGLLLAAARLRSGSLWLPIGMHAAWVAVFRIGRLFFDVRPTPVWLVGPGWPPLVGGAAGWLAIAIGAVMLARRTPARRSG